MTRVFSIIKRSPISPWLALFVIPLQLLIGIGTAQAQQDLPARCSGYGDLQSIDLSDWESGAGGWTAGRRDIVNSDTFDTPDWAITATLPDARSGSAVFVANLNTGDCGDDDEAGVLYFDSPSILLPADAEVPRLSVDHWFETEAGWDGGNFKLSVNGGPFELIPPAAIDSGAYNGALFPSQDEFGVELNSNPLAGQVAFTGTWQGNGSGQWIETRIDLTGLAAGGDSVRLRLDFGIDSCDGKVGWYVDEVEFYVCEAELPPSDCGNAVLDAGEQCDDGNDFVGDGCSNTCQVETGWQCTDPAAPADIADPGFEAGTPNPAWAESSNNPIGTPICEADACGTGSGSGASEGTYWAWFGGTSVYTEGSLSQSVTIPSTSDTLLFNLEIPACDTSADYTEVRIDGAPVFRVDGADARCDVPGYQQYTVDISAYADGQSHELQLYSETFANASGISNFFFDELAMPGDPSVCSLQGADLIFRNGFETN